MEIINPGPEDYHMHSLNYSDGMNTIDELVDIAGRMGIRQMAITDHSQVALDYYGYSRRNPRILIRRWRNIINHVKVIFGVEGDILNEEGDICDHILGEASDFLVLSLHCDVYRRHDMEGIKRGDPAKATEAYLRAMERHAARIKLIGHPTINMPDDFKIDIDAVVERANALNLPLEVNGSYLMQGKMDLPMLDRMLGKVQAIYVNSDAHTLIELRDARKAAFDYLRSKGLF